MHHHLVIGEHIRKISLGPMSTKRRWGYVEHDVLGDLDLQLKSCGRELVEIEREQGKVRDAMERNRPYRGISEYVRTAAIYRLASSPRFLA